MPVTSIAVQSVDFSHVPGKPVLTGFHAHFERRKSYAVMGPSGSGKSTLFDLLLGFYAPDAGDILINGVSIRELRLESLRGRVLLLGQQSAIFNDTVTNNVRFGSTASQAEVARACRLACVDTVIADLPQGYDTVLSYQGTNLSGGQRQRVGLARALLRKADVLLLDESTSALDRETRDLVLSNVLAEYRDRIVIFSTHDEWIARKVDVVIPIEIRAASQIDLPAH